jgi:hypothetical protein
MVMNTRLIVGLVAVTLLAVGLSVYALIRPASVLSTFATPIPIRAVPIVVTATPLEARMFGSPTALFDQPSGDLANQIAALREQVFDYPAGTVVRIGSTWIDNWERWYSVTVEDGTGLEVRESQLTFVSSTPTPMPIPPIPAKFSHLVGVDSYSLMTTEPIGHFAIGTRVRVNSTYFDGAQWVYDINADDSSASYMALEQQLVDALAASDPQSPKYAHLLGLETYSLSTLVQIGDVLPGTMVRVNNPQFDGFEWLYEAAVQGRSEWFVIKESELAPLPPTPPPPA